MTEDATRARYAIARARVEVVLVELREALDRHEATHRWEEPQILQRVEREIAALVEEMR